MNKATKATKATSKRLTKKQRAELEAAQNAALEQAIADQVAADEAADDDEPEDSSSTMAKALAKARGAYVKSKASSGKSSLHNGDTLATLLAGCEPEEVCQLADLVCEDADGTHSAKYAHLNQGQQRMNAGNKIRGRIKREEITEAKVIELAKANLGTLQGRDDIVNGLDDTKVFRTEYIEAMDREVDFTEASWARELELRHEILEAQKAASGA